MLRLRESLEPAHVGTNRFRKDDASIRLLAVLENRNHRPAHREAAAVERSCEPRLLALRGPETDLRAPGLELTERRAGADLAIGVLPRKPDLQVVSLLRRKAHVAGAVEIVAVVL